MKKYFTIILALTILINYIQAQTWDSVGCSGLTFTCGGFSGQVNCLTVYNGKLFAGGASYAGSLVINNIGQWDGNSWDSLGDGLYPCGGGPYAMAVYKGNLFVGGEFNKAGGISTNNIAMWNGTSWSSFGSGTNMYAAINSMAVYNGNLYVAGNFDTIAGIPVNSIAMWNGTSWSTVGSGIIESYDFPKVYALCVYKGRLYAGGSFDTAGNISANNIAVWNDTNWQPVTSGINIGTLGSAQHNIRALAVYDSNLYAGGYFDTAGGISANNIAMWNGAVWSKVGTGIIPNDSSNFLFGEYNRVFAMQVFNNDLYVGGCFDTAGGIFVNNIAMWNGSNWNYLAGFKAGFIDPTFVSSFAVYDGYLFAGGNFDTAGIVPTWDIAWQKSLANINDLTVHGSLTDVYPNPSNGVFHLEIKNEEAGMNTHIEIYNVLGEKVYSQSNIQASTFNIDLASQADGVYLYRVLNEDGTLAGTGKLVIQK